MTVWEAIQTGTAQSAPGLAANLLLFADYAIVGMLVLRTQLARRPALGGWSLSGLARAACS